jgi:hypothetical protein
MRVNTSGFHLAQLCCELCHAIGCISTKLSPITKYLGAQRRHGHQAFVHIPNAHHKRVRLGSRLAFVAGHRFALPNGPSILGDLVIANPVFVEISPCIRSDLITLEHYFFRFGLSITRKTQDDGTPSSGISASSTQLPAKSLAYREARKGLRTDSASRVQALLRLCR